MVHSSLSYANSNYLYDRIDSLNFLRDVKDRDDRLRLQHILNLSLTSFSIKAKNNYLPL